MNKELQHLLKEVRDLLNGDVSRDKDEIHSKLTGVYLYLEEYMEKDKRKVVEEYNKTVEMAKEAGVKSIRAYKMPVEEVEEKEKLRKREIDSSTEKADQLAMKILDKSRTLKKKSEAFGNMVEISKGILDTISSSVRKNVYQVQKGVDALEQSSWWSFNTSTLITIALFVIILFVFMYLFIRKS